MRLRHSVLAASAAALAVPSAANATDLDPDRPTPAGDWYVSSFGAALVADENNILFEQFGWQGSIAAGRRILDGRMRLEVEGTRRRIGLTGLNGASRASGEFNARSGFLNAYVHGRPRGEWDPYLGAGFGRGRQNYRLSGGADDVDFHVVMDDYSESFVYHMMAGAEFDFSPSVAGHIEARYFTLEDKTLNANFGLWKGIERSYQLGFGLTYSFGEGSGEGR